MLGPYGKGIGIEGAKHGAKKKVFQKKWYQCRDVEEAMKAHGHVGKAEQGGVFYMAVYIGGEGAKRVGSRVLSQLA